MPIHQEFIEKHLAKHAGPIAGRYENLLFVAPSEEHRCHLVVTCGLSDAPMNAEEEDFRLAELCVMLPVEWPLEYGENFDPSHLPERFFWPLRGLQRLAQLPARTNSWLGVGHTVPNGEPMRPFADDTELCAWILFPPIEFAPSFARTRISSGEVFNFHALVPIFSDELAVRRNQRLGMLLEIFARKGVSDIINPQRTSSAKSEGFGRFFKR